MHRVCINWDVQGVAIAAAMVMGVEIYEFSPKRKLKSHGEMETLQKEQVALMLNRLLDFKIDEKYYDATDAFGSSFVFDVRIKFSLLKK